MWEISPPRKKGSKIRERTIAPKYNHCRILTECNHGDESGGVGPRVLHPQKIDVNEIQEGTILVRHKKVGRRISGVTN